MPILVDTNILLDVVKDDPAWADWSFSRLSAAVHSDRVVVNAVIYAELSVAFDRVESLDAVLERMLAQIAEIPRAALFLAGRTFVKYRARGGHKSGVLPDFFIGAHAAVSGYELLTRDVGRYRTYFPRVELIAPQREDVRCAAVAQW